MTFTHTQSKPRSFSTFDPAAVLPPPDITLPKLYIVGGRQSAPRSLRAGNQDWNGYDRALIVEMNMQTRAWTPRVEYVPPSNIVPDTEPAITFQAGHIQDDKLYLCTQTEVMVYQLPSFERIWYLSLPWFNDLHHARLSPGGNLLAANAGLEMVAELAWSGDIVRAWNVLGQKPWSNVREDVDYRRISTKPHHAHPNYVFCLGKEVWATRFHQGDAVCLTNPEKRIPLANLRIHDGVVHEGRIYFSTVNGTIVVANPHTLQVDEVIDLTELHPPGMVLGWCRGLYIQGDRLWVGFSRIRPTRFRENVSWVANGFRTACPTHIACYDLTRRRCITEIDLEPTGLGAIYSIFPAA